MFRYSREVQDALAQKKPLVALESTIISHGLPRPRNMEVATEVEAIVRDNGAVPATIAIIDGAIHVGLEKEELHRIATDHSILKASIRDHSQETQRGHYSRCNFTYCSYCWNFILRYRRTGRCSPRSPRDMG